MIIHQLFRSLSRDAGLLISSTVSEQGLRTAAFILMWHRLLSSRLADNYAQSIHMDLASISVVRKRSSSVLRSASVYLVSTVQLHVDMATCCCCWWSLLYSVILRFQADSLHLYVILHEWLVFYSVFLNIHPSGVLMYLQHWHGWCHMKLLLSRHVLCTPYNHAPCHFLQSHILMVHACLAVTCHLHFWRNDWDLLRAIFFW